MAAEVDNDVIGGPSTSQPSGFSSIEGLDTHQPVDHTSRTDSLEQQNQPNGDQIEHERDVGDSRVFSAPSAESSKKAEALPEATPMQTRGLHAAERAVSAAAAEVASAAEVSMMAEDTATGSNEQVEAILQTAAELDAMESGQENVESLEDVAESGARLGTQVESAPGGDLLDEWNIQQQQQQQRSVSAAAPVLAGSSRQCSEERPANRKEEQRQEAERELYGDASIGSEGHDSDSRDLAREQQQQGQQQKAARSVLPHMESLGVALDPASAPDLAAAASLEFEGSDLSLSDLEEVQALAPDLDAPVPAPSHQEHSTSASSALSVASGSFPGQASLASRASAESLPSGDALAQAEALERDLVTGK